MTRGAGSMVSIEIDPEKCTGCGQCVELCPLSVLEIVTSGDSVKIAPAHPEFCWACMTCSGKCPGSAISIRQAEPAKRYLDDENETAFIGIGEEEAIQYAAYAGTLERILKLRWRPVAVSLIPENAALPHVPVPRTRLRYCQALIMARRGYSMLMPASAHACPDGASILGLSKIPPKLASGAIYVQLGKLATKEAAAQMVKERPMLAEESMRAILITPLDQVVMRPDVVIIMAPPETMMWLCMSSTYHTGKRMSFQMSSYNAQCVESTLYPYTTGEMNTSLGCYGCRAISDIGEEIMFMGIPMAKMPALIEGLEFLGRKAIPDARAKVYLPPLP
jgi:uncharacterized protein (DUF169 family)/NAD-dependent dihydropyrimidine dehydrogenase PreA subunit